jgi:hypothetical protein
MFMRPHPNVPKPTPCLHSIAKPNMRPTKLKTISLTFLAACSALWLTNAAHAQAPTVISAFGEYDSGTSNQFVDVTFSEAMDPASILAKTNYSIAGYTVTNVGLFTNNVGAAQTTNVVLQLSAQLTNSFTLNVSNVLSYDLVPIAAKTSVAGTLDPLASIDITAANFTTFGHTYYQGPGSYLVDASGADIWNDSDGFRFIYETRTNNFAVIVQVPYLIPADQWSKAGLMARETIDTATGTSRFIDVLTTALSSQDTLDGGTGENSLSVDARETTGAAAVEPAGFIGDDVPPIFPKQWLLLTRQISGTNDVFTCYGTTNANSPGWTQLATYNPVTIGAKTAFPSICFVGICTTAHISPPGTDLTTVQYENFGDYSTQVFLTNSPQSLTVVSGSTASFGVLAGWTGTLTVGGVAGPTSVGGLNYQWYTNGVAVAAATGSIYTVSTNTSTALNGLEVYATVSAIGGNSTNSSSATLTVVPAPVAPTIVSAVGEYDSGTSNQYVDVVFSEAMDLASVLATANYSISGNTITNVLVLTNNTGAAATNMVILQLSKPLSGSFTLAVTNLQSSDQLPITPKTTAAGTVDPMTSIDIATSQITSHGTTYFEGGSNYLVTASGNDIWNDHDGFRFVYETRTNSFDIAVQIPYMLPADQWSKGGLMARETIDPNDGGSRFIDVLVTALSSQEPLDGGNGENSLSVDARDKTDAAAYEPANFDAAVTAGGGGGDTIPPTFPNQWVRLIRSVTVSSTGTITADNFECLSSSDNVTWKHLSYWSPITNNNEAAGTLLSPFPAIVNVGMCATAHIAPPGTDLATVFFQNFDDYHPVQTLTATRSGANLIISWPPGISTLYASPVLGPNATWTPVAHSSPATVPIIGGSQFFQLIASP